MNAAGKLKPGVRIEQADADLDAIGQGLARAYPATNRDTTLFAEPLLDTLAKQWEDVLGPLCAATGFVLLIACANLANLMLARAGARRRELSVRSALGAGRARLIRELLADSIVLAAPGLALAAAIAWAVIRLFLSLIPGPLPDGVELGLNPPVLAFSAAAALLTTVVAGLAPAILASRVELALSMKAGSRGSSGGGRAKLRKLLVTVEVALATVLLTGAGLMIATTWRLRQTPLGFDPTGVVTAKLDMSAGEHYVKMAPRREIDMRFVEPTVFQFYEQLAAQAGAIPGVRAVAIASSVPMMQDGSPGSSFLIAGRPNPEPRLRPGAELSCVTGSYFEILRIPVAAGRTFTAHDTAGSPWVAVINRTLARKYFPDEDPVGKFITLTTTEFEQPRRIIGVVEDSRRFSPRNQTPPEIYMNFAQQPRLIPGNHQSLRLRPRILLRTALDAGPLGEQLRGIAMKADPRLPLFDAQLLAESVNQRQWFERFMATLLALFAGLALLLSAAGIYGLMHHAVSDRKQEIGIRLALGATRRQVLGMLLRSGMGFATLGALVGLAAALAGTRVLESFLFGVTPFDPVTFGAAASVLLAAALMASYIPARRAMAVDPVSTLRLD